VTNAHGDEFRTAEEDAAEALLQTDTDESMTDDEQAEVAEIRAEIEETRLEMGGTLNELGGRLEPAHLVEQAKENVREATIGRVEETAKGVSDMVMETIKRNPIPSALAGAGLLMLWKNREKGSGNGHSADRRYDAYYGTTSSYGQRPYGQQSQEGIGQKVGDAASTVGDTARGAVGQVGQTVGQVGDNVGQTAGQVGNEIDRFMKSNPLAVGAIALGAGALVGSLVPETSQEREMLGDASRQVSNAVRDTVDQAATKAEETMDKAEEKVSSPA
jgi:ElaB/YqjD/DUF883 family membrane-anchored ribosome-binding protein